ncbi:MAG: metal-dependent hydrolase [Anaerolineales bacterium]
MAQAGLHAMIGAVARKWMPHREWLMLGVLLGNFFPDLDNLVVAYATLAKLAAPQGFHRTFTHSLFTTVALMIVFYLTGTLTRNWKWNNFALGFGIGILMHIGVDLALWFNGVELFWPFSKYELNFWGWFVTPVWLQILIDTGEFLMFALFYLLLSSFAQKQNTDAKHRGSLRMWTILQFVLFILFTLISFILGTKGLYHTIYGGLYLLSLIVTIILTIRMRQTVEAL